MFNRINSNQKDKLTGSSAPVAFVSGIKTDHVLKIKQN